MANHHVPGDLDEHHDNGASPSPDLELNRQSPPCLAALLVEPTSPGEEEGRHASALPSRLLFSLQVSFDFIAIHRTQMLSDPLTTSGEKKRKREG